MYIIHYPSYATKNCPATKSAEAEVICELRPSMSEDFSISVNPGLTAKIWFIRFSNKWSTREHLLLNENSRIVTSKGETYEFRDFPKLAMMLERAKLEEMLEAL